MKNIFAKILIIVGDIIQILYEYFMLAIFGALAFKKWTAYESIPDSLEIQDIFHIVVTTFIFVIFVFLPYGLTKCMYWWYYEGKNISERWIKPSFVISVITVVLYIFIEIYMFI